MAGGLELVASILETGKFILIWFWWAIILLYVGYCKVKWKNWPIEAVVIEKRGNNLIKSNDRAGRYKDPYTGMIKYRLLKAGDSILVPNYDHVLHNVANHTNFFERFVNLVRGNSGTIFLFRYGSKQYKPLKVGSGGKIEYEEIKDKGGNPIIINRYIFTDPRRQLQALDFEVVDWDNMNQMVQEWQATHERRKKKSDFWKQIVIPAMILGVTAIVCIVMIKFGYDYAINMKSSPVQNTAQPKAEAPNIPVISDVIPG
jgi:hypothetical protein